MGRIILIILFFSVNLSVYSTNYYVATDGSDSDPGTLAEPFLTIQHGIDQLTAGDTLFLRGGIYYLTIRVDVSVEDGTAENPICVRAYAADHAAGNVPILDAINCYRQGPLWVHDVSWWKFWGITFRNGLQDGLDNQVRGVVVSRAPYIYFDQCVSYNHGGTGFDGEGVGTIVTFTNCDSYNNCDTIPDLPNGPGGGGGGFGLTGAYNVSDTTLWNEIYCYNCRAWDVSDNAFACAYGVKKAVFDNCWAIAPGRLSGDGRGFAMGLLYEAPPTHNQYLINNCMSVYARSTGFNVNSNVRPYQIDIRFYNNTAAYSGEYGFRGYWASDDTGPVVFKNNIAYPHAHKISWLTDSEFSMREGMNYTSDHNSWDASVTVSDADFVSVDTTGMRGARQADGSLPVITFMNLASTSDLIDAGTDVDIEYNNDAPDLGYYEYPEFDPVSAPLINTNEPVITRSREVITGGNMIYDGGGTISSKGVCISREADPDIADTVIYAGTGTDDFTIRVPNLTKNTTYHVRAYATNETGTSYGADVEFTTPASSPVETGGKLLKHGNYYIKIE